jgi:hypothetical protein
MPILHMLCYNGSFTTAKFKSLILLWLALPCPILRTCSLSWFCMSACCLHNEQAQSKCYVTTDGQSASLSWCQEPTWGLRPDFYYCQRVAGLLMWGTLSDERRGLPFTIAAGSHQRSHSWVRVPWDSWSYFLSQIQDSHNLEGQVPIFISRRNRVGQLYPRDWVPFSSPPTTRRATVEVFEPASTRVWPSSNLVPYL